MGINSFGFNKLENKDIEILGVLLVGLKEVRDCKKVGILGERAGPSAIRARPLSYEDFILI